MEKRRLLIGCEFTYVAAIPTPVVCQVQPAESPRVSIGDRRWACEPAVTVRGYADLYGNPCARAVAVDARRRNIDKTLWYPARLCQRSEQVAGARIVAADRGSEDIEP